MSSKRSTGPTLLLRLLGFLLLVCILLVPTVAQAQATIKVNDAISLRFGTLIQGWIDSTQDPASKSQANGIFLRRMRFLVGGTLSPNVSFFYETDNPNLGRPVAGSATVPAKNLGAGFITQDAFIEWKPTGSSAFIIDGGLMLIPLCRNCLESAATLLSLDYGSFSFLNSAPTQSSVGRDTGVLAKGYLAGGRFEYRAGVFEGFRKTGVANNSFRTAAHINYNVWDTEAPGYTYPGLYLGNKRVLAFGAGLDHQQDYQAFSVDGFISVPMGGAGAAGTTPPPAKNAFNAELSLFSYDGGTTFTALKEQKAATLQAGYYFAPLKINPFVRVEKQDINGTKTGDNKRAQIGLTYMPLGNNFNLRGAISRIDPSVGNKSNEYTIQMQFFYY
jgi:hypothetical protein